MVIFNVIVCNTDAHAKNYSIMLNGAGASLAPGYDVMCGEAWRHITTKLAQTIAGKNRGDEITGTDWHRFARECGLGARQVVSRVRALAESAVAEAGAAGCEVSAMPAGDHRILQQIQACITRRAETLLTQLDDAEKGEAAVGEAMLAAG
jgi:serine/threonine-protein kinase HipA